MSAARDAVCAGGILLAAGRGRRFGSDKRAARMADGTTMLERALGLLRAVCDQTLLVIGEDDPEHEYRARFAGVEVFRAPRSAAGMGFTLADAVVRARHWEACLVTLADKPFIAPATFARVRAQLGTHRLVVPTCEGRWGHPVGFARSHFHALTRLEGDSGARALIDAERDRCLFLETADPGVLADVDTPAQLEYWSGLLAR